MLTVTDTTIAQVRSQVRIAHRFVLIDEVTVRVSVLKKGKKLSAINYDIAYHKGSDTYTVAIHEITNPVALFMDPSLPAFTTRTLEGVQWENFGTIIR